RHDALLILDEVQTGMGRLGAPFGADLYRVMPDLLTTAKGVAGGFPCGALLMTPTIAKEFKPGQLGSTFGGGPLAGAAIAARIDAIEQDNLIDNVRTLSALIRETCVVGPVNGVQGQGFLLGLKTTPPAAKVRDALLARNILTGTSTDPHVLRLLPPLVLAREHVTLLAAALTERTDAALDGPRGLLARRGPRAARARRSAREEPRAARARGQGAVAPVPQPVAPHARVVPGGDGAARRRLVRDLSRDVDPRARGAQRHRDGRRRGGARARGRARHRVVRRRDRHSRVREAAQPRRRSRRPRVRRARVARGHEADDQHGVGDQPSVPEPCRLENARRARHPRERRPLRIVLGLSSEGAAARGAVRDGAYGRDARHGGRRASARRV